MTGLIDSLGRPGTLICDHGEVEFKSYYRTQFPKPVKKIPTVPNYSILNKDISILGLDLFKSPELEVENKEDMKLQGSYAEVEFQNSCVDIEMGCPCESLGTPQCEVLNQSSRTSSMSPSSK